MKVLHYVPSLAVRTGGVAAYLAVLSLELGGNPQRGYTQNSARLVVLFFC